MAYLNSRYDNFMPEYERIRNENLTHLEERKEELFHKIPRLREIATERATGAITFAKGKLNGEYNDIQTLQDYLDKLDREQDALLLSNGYAVDSFEPIYTCPACQDTGFIDGEPCRCLKQRMINEFYAQSNLQKILLTENFSNFDLSYYSKETDDKHSASPYDHMAGMLSKAEAFARNFKEQGGNLLLHGNTGLGKTYLSNCIAKALLDEGITVLYLTSTRLFENILPGIVMRKDESEENLRAYQYIYNCDLLIIDDLGTEMVNNFTRSQLYKCVNERILSSKSTIISTNKDLKELRDLYDERIVSRIAEHYHVFEFYGDDIRYLKRCRMLNKK